MKKILFIGLIISFMFVVLSLFIAKYISAIGFVIGLIGWIGIIFSFNTLMFIRLLDIIDENS